MRVTVNEVQKKRMTKAAGPDGVPPRVARLCSAQLSSVLTGMFNLSLSYISDDEMFLLQYVKCETGVICIQGK